MNDTIIFAGLMFLFIPAAAGWAVGLAGLWAWWTERRTATEFNNVAQINADSTVAAYKRMVESRRNAEVVHLTPRGPRSA